MTWIKEHKLVVAVIIVTAICLGVFGVILVDMTDKQVASSSQVSSNEEKTSTDTNPEEVDEITDNPFGDQNTNLSEDEILNYMHGMSHQKVVAEEKWIHYEMTNERIEFLISVVESGSYDNGDLYLDILNRWSEGDFTKADKDHNSIWELQGGTIGKATGVLTPVEEQQYLENHKSSIQ